MNSLGNVSLIDLLPPSISSDAAVIAACKSLDKELIKLHTCIGKLNILPNIDGLDHHMLNLLAYQFDAPFYDSSLSIDKKRELVKHSINWHKKKGTVAATEEIVSLIFGESSIEEWYKYDGEPHHFRITTTNISVDNSFIDKFKAAIEHIKRKSSWLDDVIVNIASECIIYTGFAIHTAERITIRQEG